MTGNDVTVADKHTKHTKWYNTVQMRYTIAARAAMMLFAAFSLSLRADWRDEMFDGPVTIREGVQVRAVALKEPRLIKAYIVKVDLTTPGMSFTSTERVADWGAAITGKVDYVAETKLERTSDFMMRRRREGLNVEVAVNTTPWHPFPAPRGETRADLQGISVADGVEVSPEMDGRGVFFVKKDGSASIELSVPPDVKRGDIAFAVGAFGLIMKDGENVSTTVAPPGLHPRVAFGLDKDAKTLVILEVDGRQPGYSMGADMNDICAILKGEGVTDAVNMDGGGSSSLVVFDRRTGKPWMLNRHKDMETRATATNFGIVFPEFEPATRALRTGAVLHSYEFAPIEDTPAPEGYSPFYISHYGRHGSRRLNGTFMQDVMKVMKHADRHGLLTARGKDLFAALRRLWAAHDGMIGQLASRGAEEQGMLARRMAQRFGIVFADGKRVRCQSSTVHRVLTSQANFTTVLKDRFPTLDFDYSAGEKFQRVLNKMAFAGKKERRKFSALCSEHAKAVKPDALVGRFFTSDKVVGDKVKFAKDLFSCASVCQCLRTELDGLELYSFFEPGEIDVLYRVQEADMYSTMANSEEMGAFVVEAARPLGLDIVSRAENAIADDRVAADLRFGHDGGLWPLAGFLGIVGPGDRVPSTESWKGCPAWRWMSMASNLQLVFYRRAKSDILFKVLYNEQEMQLRGLTPVAGPYYKWDDLRKKISSS